MSTQHTPGPWRIWRDQDPKQPLKIAGASSETICTFDCYSTSDAANIALITASPDLLSALKGFMKEYGGGPERLERPEQKAALAAIAKAEGRTV